MKFTIVAFAITVLLASMSIMVSGCSTSRTVWVNESVDAPPYDAKLIFEGEDIAMGCAVSSENSRAVRFFYDLKQVEQCILFDRLDVESQNKLRNLDFESNRVAIVTIQYLSDGKVSFRKYRTEDNELIFDFVERKPSGCGSDEIREKQFLFIVKVYVPDSEST